MELSDVLRNFRTLAVLAVLVATGYTLRPEGVHFVYRSDGRLTGEAFAIFTNPEDARAAHRAKDRSMIGSRYVEIFPSTLEECARMTGQKV
jgi:hypothetical protein